MCRLSVRMNLRVESRRVPSIVVTAHNHVLSRQDTSATTKSLYRAVERSLVDLTACYIAVSDSIGRELVEAYGIPADKVAIVHNGIDPKPFLAPQDRESARAELNLPSPDTAVVGLAARFSSQKGLRHLVAAIPDLREGLHTDGRELVVVIGGTGPLDAELREQAAALEVSGSLRWPGHVHSVPRFLSALDVYVSPADTEALGIGLIEAAIAQVPTVATKVGGVPEVVIDAETGVLVPAGDVAALARAVLGLLRDPERAAALARSARERCVEEFALTRMIGNTLAVYADVCSSPEAVRKGEGSESIPTNS